MTKREELLQLILSLTPAQADEILSLVLSSSLLTEAETQPCPQGDSSQSQIAFAG